jgi:hypothetical protein
VSPSNTTGVANRQKSSGATGASLVWVAGPVVGAFALPLLLAAMKRRSTSERVRQAHKLLLKQAEMAKAVVSSWMSKWWNVIWFMNALFIDRLIDWLIDWLIVDLLICWLVVFHSHWILSFPPFLIHSPLPFLFLQSPDVDVLPCTAYSEAPIALSASDPLDELDLSILLADIVSPPPAELANDLFRACRDLTTDQLITVLTGAVSENQLTFMQVELFNATESVHTGGGEVSRLGQELYESCVVQSIFSENLERMFANSLAPTSKMDVELLEATVTPSSLEEALLLMLTATKQTESSMHSRSSSRWSAAGGSPSVAQLNRNKSRSTLTGIAMNMKWRFDSLSHAHSKHLNCWFESFVVHFVRNRTICVLFLFFLCFYVFTFRFCWLIVFVRLNAFFRTQLRCLKYRESCVNSMKNCDIHSVYWRFNNKFNDKHFCCSVSVFFLLPWKVKKIELCERRTNWKQSLITACEESFEFISMIWLLQLDWFSCNVSQHNHSVCHAQPTFHFHRCHLSNY